MTPHTLHGAHLLISTHSGETVHDDPRLTTSPQQPLSPLEESRPRGQRTGRSDLWKGPVSGLTRTSVWTGLGAPAGKGPVQLHQQPDSCCHPKDKEAIGVPGDLERAHKGTPRVLQGLQSVRAGFAGLQRGSRDKPPQEQRLGCLRRPQVLGCRGVRGHRLSLPADAPSDEACRDVGPLLEWAAQL